MATDEIVILSLTAALLIGGVVLLVVQFNSWRWPDGRRVKRRTGQGVEVTTIDAPGASAGERAEVGQACVKAVEIVFDMYASYRGVKPWEEIDRVAVQFIPDAEMDRIQKVSWPQYKSVAAYLVTVSRYAGSQTMPLAIIRESLAPLVVEKGAPVIHEMMHALRGEFSGERLDRDHSHEVWTTLVPAAQNYFASGESN